MISKLSALGVGLLAGWLVVPAQAIEGPFSQSYRANSVVLVNLVGRVEIEVGGSNVSVGITGESEELQAIEVTGSGTVVRIESSKRHHRISGDAADHALYKITVPKGADLTVDGLVGEAEIGDIGGRLKLSATALDGHIGDVSAADIELNGSSDLGLGDVAGRLSIEISGSGSIETGDADSANVEIAGSGDVSIKEIRHGLNAKIAGSGDISVGGVNGPVTAALAGSGDVAIDHGRADPLKVEILGSGDFDFGGEAVDPDISVFGSGDVHIASYTGKLQSHGTANLTIGK